MEEALRLAKAKSRQVRKTRSPPIQDEIDRIVLTESTFDKVANRTVQGVRPRRGLPADDAKVATRNLPFLAYPPNSDAK